MKKLLISLLCTVFIIQAQTAEKFIQPPLERRYDETCWLGAHNAYASEHDLKGNAAYVYANQFYNLKEQLDRGVRVFEIDTYRRCIGKTLGMFGSESCTVSVCHGGCDTNRAIYKPWNQITGTDAMDFVKDVLPVFKDFLEQNKQEIVTLSLEDYVTPKFGASSSFLDSQFEAAGINYLILKPEDWNPDKNKGWPTLQWMVANNKRLIVFNESGSAAHGFKTNLRFASTKYTYDQDATMVRNQWGGAKDPLNKAIKERASSAEYDTIIRYLFEIDWYPDGGKILGGAPSTLINKIAGLFDAEKESPFGGDFDKLNGPDLQNFVTTVLRTGLKTGIAKNRYPNIIKVDYFNEGNPSPLSLVNKINQQANDKTRREKMFGPLIAENK